jgi:hypothetical protein
MSWASSSTHFTPPVLPRIKRYPFVIAIHTVYSKLQPSWCCTEVSTSSTTMSGCRILLPITTYYSTTTNTCRRYFGEYPLRFRERRGNERRLGEGDLDMVVRRTAKCKRSVKCRNGADLQEEGGAYLSSGAKRLSFCCKCGHHLLCFVTTMGTFTNASCSRVASGYELEL